MRAVALAALALGGCFGSCDDRPIVDTQTWTFAVEHQGARGEAEVSTYGKCGEPSPNAKDTPQYLAQVAREQACDKICDQLLAKLDHDWEYRKRHEACEKECAANGKTTVVGCGSFHGRDPNLLPLRPVIDKLTPEGQRPH